MKDILAPLSDPSVDSILFVGIGNRLKSDDAVGIIICEQLVSTERKQILIVESGIEKYVGKINSLSPDILILIDCTDFNREPGYFKLFSVTEIPDNTFHTHTISIGRIAEFFEMETYILGVQPAFVGFGEEISPAVRETADLIIDLLNNNL